MTVGQLLREATSRELTEWQIFLAADAERREKAREAARLEAEIGDS